MFKIIQTETQSKCRKCQGNIFDTDTKRVFAPLVIQDKLTWQISQRKLRQKLLILKTTLKKVEN